MRGNRKPVTVIVISAALAIGGASAALAGTEPDPNDGDVVLGTAGGLRYSAEVLPLSGTVHYNHPEAGCGRQTRHAVGGGWLITGAPLSGRKGESQQPVDYVSDADTYPDEGWSASAFASVDGNVTGFAICERGTMPAYQLHEELNGTTHVRTANLQCAPGTGHIVGGGVSIATSNSYTIASRPADGPDADHRPDDGWFGKVYDTNASGIGGFGSSSVCQTGVVHYEHASAHAQPGHSVAKVARCPAGTHVADGGGTISGPGDQVHLAGSYPVDTADGGHVPDDGWKTLAFNGSGSKQKLSTYAVCL